MSETAVKKEWGTSLSKATNVYMDIITSELENSKVSMDEYTKFCIINGMGAINNAMKKEGINWQSPELDKDNVQDILLRLASLKLNASAQPREVFFTIRNVKQKGKDGYMKQIEMGIEGDGYDSILSRFGRGIETVHQFWLVRENDMFKYPAFKGIEQTAPLWEPTGSGKVIRVVYPVVKTDGVVEFLIAERGDVIANLCAHINQNLMNETFELWNPKDLYNAPKDIKKKIKIKKQELTKRVKELGLDGALDDIDLQDHISPAWTEEHSREAMIIRKMRNNATRKVPKDFSTSVQTEAYDSVTDDSYRTMKKEIAENANGDVIDIAPDDYKVNPTEENESDDTASNNQTPPQDEPKKEDEAPLDNTANKTDGPDF